MNAVVLAFAAIASASVAALGQGQFVFNNHVPPDIDARFVRDSDPPGTSSVGTDFTVQLFDVSAGIQTPLNPAGTTFRGPAGSAVAGYVTPTTETVPGVPPGSTASILVSLVGPSCDDVHGTFNYGPWPVTLGGGTITPPNLPLGTSPIVIQCIPEPCTTVLALLGTGAALLTLRKRERYRGVRPGLFGQFLRQELASTRA